MSDVIFDDLKPVLTYFPVKVGKAEMTFNGEFFRLTYDSLQWCVLNCGNKRPNFKFREIKEQFIELNTARGRVVTTGLGFGIIQSILSQREDVSEITVYEKYEDIIKMFLLFAKESNFDTSKIQILNEDATNCKKEVCDWLIMDHFECTHQPIWEIIDLVRDISYNSNASNVLFWPMYNVYIEFCRLRSLKFDQQSYIEFKKLIKIDKLPNQINDGLFEKFDYFVKTQMIYMAQTVSEYARQSMFKKL